MVVMASIAVVAAAAFVGGGLPTVGRAAVLGSWLGEAGLERGLTIDVLADCLQQGNLADSAGGCTASSGQQPADSLCTHRAKLWVVSQGSCRSTFSRAVGRGSRMLLQQWAKKGSNHVRRASAWTLRATPPSLAAVQRILVCGDPMCEEAGAAEVLQSLREHEGVSCRVDDTGCLGCCGEGPQVCLEYKGGGAQIVCGTAAALSELDIVQNITTEEDVIISNLDSAGC